MCAVKDIWIVVELDRRYNDLNIERFAGVLGPYTEAEARARADELNARDIYATKFSAERVNTTRHYTDG